MLNELPAECKTLPIVLTASEKGLNLDELLPKLVVAEDQNDKPATGQRARHMWQDLAMGKPQGGREAHQARSQNRLASATTVARLGISRNAAESISLRSKAR